MLDCSIGMDPLASVQGLYHSISSFRTADVSCVLERGIAVGVFWQPQYHFLHRITKPNLLVEHKTYSAILPQLGF